MPHLAYFVTHVTPGCLGVMAMLPLACFAHSIAAPKLVLPCILNIQRRVLLIHIAP
jgi:hypothetical protein